MSYTHLLIAKDEHIYFTSMHYRTAMKLLESGIEKVLPLLRHKFLDSGYIVVDLNRKVVINAQSAFPLKSNLEVMEP